MGLQRIVSDVRQDILIVGGGHAGATTAVALRQRKFEGSISILTDEADLPYERPPLSKEYLSGEKTFERLLLRPANFWAEKDVSLRLGKKVVSVDAANHQVTIAGSETLSYGKLVWAAGGQPRQLPCGGHQLTGVHTVRTRPDVDQLRREVESADRVIVVGGGYIGLEAAAVLSKLGKKVIVLEALDRVLARVAGEPLSRFFEAEHRAHGVELRFGVTVDSIAERDGRAIGVVLADGQTLPCDMVIVGIGIVPAVEPLIAAGAEGGNGVKVDSFCRTSMPDVFAIGDCALHPNQYAAGALIRLESVQNANDQAMTVAKALTGIEEPYTAMPWFWSHQYDLHLQTVGLATGHDRLVVRGDMSSRSFSIVYLREEKIVALDCVNATRDYVQGRALVSAGLRIADAMHEAQLRDASVPLKSLAAAPSPA